MCECPRVVNPSTGLGGAGGATFFCMYVCSSVPPFCDRPICLLCIHYPLPLYVPVPSSVLCMLHLLAVYVLECTYVRTGLLRGCRGEPRQSVGAVSRVAASLFTYQYQFGTAYIKRYMYWNVRTYWNRGCRGEPRQSVGACHVRRRPLYVPVLVRYCIHLAVYVSLACV